MMRRFALAIFVGLTLAVSPSTAQDRIPQLITVIGEGEVSIAPDLAILGGGVTTTGKTAREASDANTKVMMTVVSALKAAGIDEKDIQTTRLSLQPLRDTIKNDPRITGYQARNQVRVKVRDVTKVSDTTDRLVSAGANDIGGIQFVISSPSKALDEGRIAAMTDAKRKAEIYAKSAGATLGAVVSITESGAEPPAVLGMFTGRAGSMAPPVSSGEETQRVSVSVSYELQR